MVVAEQNLGQFAAYLRMKIDGFTPREYNEVTGQPLKVSKLTKAFSNIIHQ